jgi:hypothetical protein
MPYRDPEKEKEYQRAYREKNLERELARGRAYQEKNRSALIANQAQIRNELDDVYVRRVLQQSTGIPRADIPPELIEAKRLEIKLKRLIKEMKK